MRTAPIRGYRPVQSVAITRDLDDLILVDSRGYAYVTRLRKRDYFARCFVKDQPNRKLSILTEEGNRIFNLPARGYVLTELEETFAT